MFGEFLDPATRAALREKERERLLESTRAAATSGGISGGITGAMGRLLAGRKNPMEILKAALGVGALGAGLAGGATYVGGQLMGPAPKNDPSSYTTRGGLGGLVGGGLVGAALGGLIGGGKLRVPKIAGVTDNIIGDKLASLALSPSSRNAKIGAALGGAGLGAGAGYLGADEGMQLDFLKNEVAKSQKKRMQRQLAGPLEDFV